MSVVGSVAPDDYIGAEVSCSDMRWKLIWVIRQIIDYFRQLLTKFLRLHPVLVASSVPVEANCKLSRIICPSLSLSLTHTPHTYTNKQTHAHAPLFLPPSGMLTTFLAMVTSSMLLWWSVVTPMPASPWKRLQP